MILRALLFFLFSASVVAIPRYLGVIPDQKPVHSVQNVGRPILRSVPIEAYGRWYRLVGPGRPTVPAIYMNDVILFDNPSVVKIFQLLDEPGQLREDGVIPRDRRWDALVGHWIRYPTHGDSKASRKELLVARVIGAQVVIEISSLEAHRHLDPPHEVNLDDHWYRLFHPNTADDRFNDVMQVANNHHSVTLWSSPDPAHGHQLVHVENMQHFQLLVGPWRRYPTRRTPHELRNQVAYVYPPRNGQFEIVLIAIL